MWTRYRFVQSSIVRPQCVGFLEDAREMILSLHENKVMLVVC